MQNSSNKLTALKSYNNHSARKSDANKTDYKQI